MTPTVPFADLTPAFQIWVAAGAAAGGDGSKAHPFATIQAAVRAARPGAAIMVRAGLYAENVKLPATGGTPSAPIWLVSADGPQAAHIAGGPAKPGIQGLGTDNYIVKGFWISGAYDGVQFSQSGRDFSNLVNNIVIQGNLVEDVVHDGIKVGQADNAWILDNRIRRTRTEEGIDTLAITNSTIARNEVSETGSTAAGIFAKGGAFRVRIQDNHVHDVAGDGISVGGWTGDEYFKPGFRGFEAREVTATGNLVERAGKQPMSFRGAQRSAATDNALDATGGNGVAFYVTHGNPDAAVVAYSRDLSITDNAVRGARTLLRVDPGNARPAPFERNGPRPWSQPVGPRPYVLWGPAPARP